MPLVRISHAAESPADQVAALSQGVQQALIGAFAVPRDDYFQIVTEHPARVGIVGPVRVSWHHAQRGHGRRPGHLR